MDCSGSMVKNNPHGITISRREHKYICHTDRATKTSELCFLLCHGSQVWWYTPAVSEHGRVSSWQPFLSTGQVWGLDNTRPCLQNQNRKKKKTEPKTNLSHGCFEGRCEVWEVSLYSSECLTLLIWAHHHPVFLSVNNTGKDSCNVLTDDHQLPDTTQKPCGEERKKTRFLSHAWFLGNKTVKSGWQMQKCDIYVFPVFSNGAIICITELSNWAFFIGKGVYYFIITLFTF